jgi:hypothetical protein
MKNFRKLALASGVAVALSGVSLPSHAIIEGDPGEALLVPFVLYDSVSSVNTLVEVTVPSAVGRDVIPNEFTAPNTTPTNIPATEVADPDLGPIGAFTAGIHIYFFDEESVEQLNTDLPTSPDDFILINWGDLVARIRPSLNGTKGYMIVTNEKDAGTWQEEAEFSMFGDAYMVFPAGVGFIDAKIPVLPMSDGEDDTGDAPEIGNEVVFNQNGGIAAASPLAAGMRTNIVDGVVGGHYTLFDLTMSNRFLPTLHVIWVDDNIGQSNTSYVFNDQEQDCSVTLPIENELNVYWTSPVHYHPLAPDWVDAAIELCYPEGFLNFPNIVDSDIFYPGFVRFQIDEYAPEAQSGLATSSAVAFSIQMQVDIIDNEHENVVFVPQLLPIETALGHQRGKFVN